MKPGQLSINPYDLVVAYDGNVEGWAEYVVLLDCPDGFLARPDHRCIDYTMGGTTITYCLKPAAWQALSDGDKPMMSVVFSGMAIRHGMLANRKSSGPKIQTPPFCEWVEYLKNGENQ